MSTTPISSSGLTSGSSITSTGSALQITGLASGLDTNSIVQALLSDQTQHITNLTTQQNNIKTLDNLLTTIQTSLQGLALNAQALDDPGLFSSGETVTSSDSALVSATSASAAAIGGHTMSVSQLASAATRTFTFTSSTSADKITIDGHDTNLAANASLTDFVSAINSDPKATVYAATTGDGSTVVLSSRSTGDSGTSFIVKSNDSQGLLTQNVDTDGNDVASEGLDAHFIVDNKSNSSPTNTVTNGIAGVTLQLGGTTATGSSVTLVIGAPQANTSAIGSAVSAFVSAYNSIIDQISAQTTQTTSTTAPTQGLLFGDNDLTNLLSNMRTTMYTPNTTLAKGFQSLADIGISTGAASGNSPFSQDAVSGKLTVDTTALNNAITNNPNAVKALLQSFGSRFSDIVNAEAGPGGSIDARVQGNSSEVSDIGTQISTLNDALSARQTALQAQFAQLEATLATFQTQGSWLTQQINSLPLPAAL